ncbi:MAG: hypothetical protein K9K86_08615, partial [Pseudomonadales bacterium]|nr:hypothetical protein [Pseudomonadales bacterium]
RAKLAAGRKAQKSEPQSSGTPHSETADEKAAVIQAALALAKARKEKQHNEENKDEASIAKSITDDSQGNS